MVKRRHRAVVGLVFRNLLGEALLNTESGEVFSLVEADSGMDGVLPDLPEGWKEYSVTGSRRLVIASGEIFYDVWWGSQRYILSEVNLS